MAAAGGGGGSAHPGRAVFDANRCANCHAISGVGSSKAPDLSHVGSEAEHSVEWLAAHIKNARTHNPRSKMPSFEGKISDADLKALTEYLASLK